ncbi:carbohydrate ABC transporter permease [Clostridium sp. MCC353]|uniref:carbohydrate ABC transporter permease n=1 Tax=Clostridium sp. MCC353 TaxID=2592646 RepID=UPI002079D72E|nr:carbohydrate ABC transporter permease [Clostridium sp. MCC353]
MTAIAMGMKKKKNLENVIFHVVVGGVAVLMFYPIIWMFFSSFKETRLVMTTVTQLFPKEWTLDNYFTGWKGFGGITFATFFKNSLVITLLSTTGAVLSSSMVAYGFARIQFKGKNALFFCMIITMMLPHQVIMIPQYIIFNMLGWVNTALPIVVPSWFAKAFFIFMIMQFIEGVPRELDEAARIDGCSDYSIFTHIIVPLVRPAMVTCAIFEFYWKWDDYMGSLLYLNSPQKYTVAIALKNFTDPMSSSDYGAMFAMCVLSLLPVIIIFLLLQKYIVEGVASSGIKG